MSLVHVFRCVVLLAFLTGLTLPARARPGDPDLFFGTGGIVEGTVPEDNWHVTAVAVQSDGRIIAAGLGDRSFYIARFSEDGARDPSFGTGGTVKTPLGTEPDNGFAWLNQAVVQTDGKIVVTGWVTVDGSSPSKLVLVRYLPDCSPDLLFGNAGKILIGTPETGGVGWDLALQSDGKILVLGMEALKVVPPYKNAAILYRFLPDGSPDASFGEGGRSPFPNLPVAQKMAVQTDGKIILGSRFTTPDGIQHIRLDRCDAAGTLDATFGTGGTVIDTFPGMNTTFAALTLQKDGKIFVAATVSSDSAPGTSYLLCRFNTDGSLDTSFNGTGRVITRVDTGYDGSPSTDAARALAVQSDGKPVIAGYSYRHVLIRYLPDGGLDPDFGEGGIARGGIADPWSIALQADGKIVTGSGDIERVLVRILARPDGSHLTAERSDGTPLTATNPLNLGPVGINSVHQTTVTVRNTGDAPIAGLRARLSGPDASLFTLRSPVPETLAGNSAVPLTIEFVPGSELRSFTAVLLIDSSEPYTDGPAFFLYATTDPPVATLAVFEGGLTLAPGSVVAFGPGVPERGLTRAFTIKNNGNIDLTLQSLSLASSGTPGDFTFTAPAADLLEPGATATFTVTYTASGPGPRTATLRIASTDTFNPPFELHLEGGQAGSPDTWRQAWFDTTLNEGAAADLSDPDHDGIPNLLEYAFLTNPLAPGPPAAQLVVNGSNLEYSFARPSAAVSFFVYTLEWSDSLQSPWRTDDVVTSFISDAGSRQQVNYTVPAGSSGRFVRLRVSGK